ncbi:MAG: HlyD family efflux transporter periplasmic adaptor subunit [Alphaproteobacteria bacterium]|jgi:HlyD family secretion protein|nr:HlyD family efflux transporter periplasmic adaptor subunit [Alphaproteobacteria bacterium]
MSRLVRRLLSILVLSAVVTVALLYAFWPRPVPVDLAEIRRGLVRVTIEDEGETRVKDIYVVSAPLAGRLLRIEREVGDRIDANETLLATLEPADPSFLDARSEREAQAEVRAAEAAQGLAEAELARAEAELEFAEAELERARPLARKGTISLSALDRAVLEVKTRKAARATAQAALRVKRHELETARARLIAPAGGAVLASGEATCCAEIRAPVSGQVLKILQESEAVVAAGTPLLEVGDPAALEIVVDLLSADAVKVRKGATVIIEEWGGDKPLSGRVLRVEPYGFTKVSALGIEEQRVNVVIAFDSPADEWQGLGHGYRVALGIVVAEANDVVVAPLGALFRAGDDWAAFVVEDGRAKRRRISLGRRNQHEAEVREGLGAGEVVVLYPRGRVADGIAVTAREATLRR